MPISSVECAAGSLVRRRTRRHLAHLHHTHLHHTYRRRAHLPTRIAALAVIALMVGGCAPAASTAVTDGGPSDASVTTSTSTLNSTNRTAGQADSPGISLVATARGHKVIVRSDPGGKALHALSNPSSTSTPLTFLVLDSKPGWLRVALPIRPNGSTGWISAADVTLATTAYRLIISKSKHTLDVEYQGRRIARHPVGVGKSTTPTPDGTYYLTELIQPADSSGAYGPYAFGLSAFSNTLTTFAGGPGQLGLHGTDAPNGLGHDVSHGCLRLANSVITQLAGQLPLGTPVEIRN